MVTLDSKNPFLNYARSLVEDMPYQAIRAVLDARFGQIFGLAKYDGEILS